MSTGGSYEFTQQQNEQIGSLAHKMNWVGLFLATVGVINLLMAILLVVTVYRSKLPAEWVSKLPPEAQAQMENLPPNNQLWSFAINATLVGVIYLCMGIWTRASSASFRQIVDTRGQDINHLMNALSSLHKQYALLYSLLVITVLLILVACGIALYDKFAK